MTLAFRARRFAAPFLFALVTVGCGSDDDAADEGAQLQQEVVQSYAALVSSSYADALKTAKALDTSVVAFLDDPTEDSFRDAKDAWIASRNPYSDTEAFRFYQGPIDNDTDDDIEDGPEGRINSWPLDEAFIDYVVDGEGEVVVGGIVNDDANYPTLDADSLSAANAVESETSVSTGYHAIEFLLWGQDLSATGPGERPYTDYVVGEGGTAENQARRADYLRAVSQLLVDDLTTVNDAWADGAANYREYFLGLPPKEALGKILLGMGSLAGAELSHERLEVAFENKEQEDEHSCFSDNTLEDLEHNAKSVQNALLGRNAKVSGPGVVDLIEAKDAALAQELRDGIQEAIDEIDEVKKLGVPFDQAILGDDDSEARQHLAAAIQALKTFAENLVEGAQAIDIELKFDE
ncbi:MAG: iron-regulated protein [Myxococcales bacterium]|nr:MAG: iron-regulated protein [Myxococcales bacterium]